MQYRTIDSFVVLSQDAKHFSRKFLLSSILHWKIRNLGIPDEVWKSRLVISRQLEWRMRRVRTYLPGNYALGHRYGPRARANASWRFRPRRVGARWLINMYPRISPPAIARLRKSFRFIPARRFSPRIRRGKRKETKKNEKSGARVLGKANDCCPDVSPWAFASDVQFKIKFKRNAAPRRPYAHSLHRANLLMH